MNSQSGRLPEAQVINAFHAFLKNALAQAKADHLLDEETLASAEADIMIAGPALCLYFAAIRSTTSPPGVPLPRNALGEPVILSSQTCPTSFINFFALWSSSVPSIQSLSKEQKYDLARAICEQPPVSSNPHPATMRIAADLRAVAIEISQRRTFQDRYGADLQAVLDSDGSKTNRTHSARAQFVPPPAYDEPSRLGRSPTSRPEKPSSVPDSSHLAPPKSPTLSTRSSRSSSSRAEPSRSRSHSPSILTDHDPIIDLIRETLYASLGDILAQKPALRTLLKNNPARGYYASVALAVLDVATNAVTSDGSVHGVLGQYVTFEECPDALKPAMRGLDGIARRAKEIAEEDDQHAMELLAQGKDEELAGLVTRMERLKLMLENGVGVEENETPNGVGGRVSPNGSTIQLANKVNGLTLALTSLPAFRERQGEVFKTLVGVS